jgi:hypothetical protein
MLKINLLTLTVMFFLGARAGASEQIWQEVSELQARSVDTSERQYRVDNLALRASLQRVTEVIGPGSVQIISLPMPDGSMADFEIFESPIMSDELAQRYPEIKTYQVHGIDDPIASGRLDITPKGFHAMLYTSQGRLFIDPHSNPLQSDRYQARTRRSSALSEFSCGVERHNVPAVSSNQSAMRTSSRIPASFLQYRIAVSATREYVNLVAATPVDVAGAQAEIVTVINRVNEIYKRDLGISLLLVSDETLIELGANVVFKDNDAFTLLEQNQAWIDSEIGPANYDIGHIFGGSGGGLARLGSVCDSGNKAKGVSGAGGVDVDPKDDPFYIDYVAHEIGHQFDADHSFNGTTRACGGDPDPRNAATAYEPGSGSTIMAYAGICGVEDLQDNSDATFHAGSIAQVNSFTNAGGSCFTPVDANPANDHEPMVTAIADQTIPANTAFVLDTLALDDDPQQLSYQWDQMDRGCPTDSVSFGTDTGFNGLFRSYAPRIESMRHFPALGTQLRGLYDDAEVMPCNNRKLNFRFTARDGFSGQDTTDVELSVVDTGAVFEILNLDTGATIVNPAAVDVLWEVADTNLPPISCDFVDIDLLTFQDANYSRYSVHPLANDLPNNGTASVLITPNDKSHPRARIRVKCDGNVFYDISDVDFAIDGVDPETASFTDADNAAFFNDNGTTGEIAMAPACGAIAVCEIPPDPDDSEDGGSGNGDSSAVDYRWLLLMGGFLLIARVRRARGN